MKKLLPIILAVVAVLVACNEDEKSTWDEYRDWRELNNSWLEELTAKTNDDGTPYYTKVVPGWNPDAYVLMHFYNDRKETEGNLSPLYTSTVATRYKLHLCDGTPVDSSDLLVSNGPGIYQAQLNEQIQGWGIALPEMRCGDTAEVIIPYGVAYGAQKQGVMKPYSNLRFNVRLVDIPFYEKTPYE